MQNHYNLIYREEEREMLPLCADGRHRRDPVDAARAGPPGRRPWSPEPQTERAKTDTFAKGLFEKTEAIDKPVIDRVQEIASGSRCARPRTLPWRGCCTEPVVTSPIVGATKPHHLEDAIASLSVTLSNDEMTRLKEIYQPHPLASAFS